MYARLEESAVRLEESAARVAKLERNAAQDLVAAATTRAALEEFKAGEFAALGERVTELERKVALFASAINVDVRKPS